MDDLKSTLYADKSNIENAGKGLFTRKAIKTGTLLGFCETKETNVEDEHTLWLEDGPINVTCILKYINHSETPNVAYYDDLSVVSIADIAPGDELTHFYSEGWSPE